jgi:hypothetical protein
VYLPAAPSFGTYTLTTQVPTYIVTKLMILQQCTNNVIKGTGFHIYFANTPILRDFRQVTKTKTPVSHF